MGASGKSRSDGFWLLVVVSAAYWLLAALLGGGGSAGDRSLSIDWMLGALINFALLCALWSYRVWAWHVLLFISVVSATLTGLLFYDDPLGLIALFPLTQIVLLWRMRTPRPAATRSVH